MKVAVEKTAPIGLRIWGPYRSSIEPMKKFGTSERNKYTPLIQPISLTEWSFSWFRLRYDWTVPMDAMNPLSQC
jgi:hypothetical protein